MKNPMQTIITSLSSIPGASASIVSLQKISYISKAEATAGQTVSTWCYSNRVRQQVNAFGDSGTGISYSCYNVQTKQSVTPKSSINDGLIHTFWLNGMSDEDVKVYTELYGKECVCYIDPDGSAHLLDEAEAQKVADSFNVPDTKGASKNVNANA